MKESDSFNFFDDDKTRIHQASNERARYSDQEQKINRIPTPQEHPALVDCNSLGFADNPIVSSALSLLLLVSKIASTPSHSDVEGLRQRLVDEILRFEKMIIGQGLSSKHAELGKYMLCSMLDETIQHTPWIGEQWGQQNLSNIFKSASPNIKAGAIEQWGQQSLSNIFFKESLGGERFFPIVVDLCKFPTQNIFLIELSYLCLSLGFQGEFRIKRNGLNELEQYRAELYQLIQRVRGDYERSLSPRWQGLKDVRGALARYVPLWVIAAVAGAVLVSAYLWFFFSINDVSEATRIHLAGLGNEQIKTAAPLPPPVPPPPPVPHRAERFTVLLRDEIDKGMVKVIDDRTLLICDSFPSGGDQIDQKFVPMLKKIAGELLATDAVEVTGHTDDVPIRSARFPSNWDLSVARAQHVADILRTAAATTAGMTVRGRGKDLPLAANDSPEHRAQNRRVDILIQ